MRLLCQIAKLQCRHWHEPSKQLLLSLLNVASNFCSLSFFSDPPYLVTDTDRLTLWFTVFLLLPGMKWRQLMCCSSARKLVKFGLFATHLFSYKTREFWRFGHKLRLYCIFLIRMRESGVPVWNLTSLSCSWIPISYKTREFRRFGHKLGLYCIFVNAHARNYLISTSDLKSDITTVFLDPDFL